jgi:hypothetical protein
MRRLLPKKAVGDEAGDDLRVLAGIRAVAAGLGEQRLVRATVGRAFEQGRERGIERFEGDIATRV